MTKIYIHSNVTFFPSVEFQTLESIRCMTFRGFSEDTTEDDLISIGFIPVEKPEGSQPLGTILVINRTEPGDYSALWMNYVEYTELLDDARYDSIIRNTRNALLKESDWTQINDAPVDKQAWAEYRQLLRDITQQEGFPRNISWPIKP